MHGGGSCFTPWRSPPPLDPRASGSSPGLGGLDSQGPEHSLAEKKSRFAGRAASVWGSTPWLPAHLTSLPSGAPPPSGSLQDPLELVPWEDALSPASCPRRTRGHPSCISHPLPPKLKSRGLVLISYGNLGGPGPGRVVSSSFTIPLGPCFTPPRSCAAPPARPTRTRPAMALYSARCSRRSPRGRERGAAARGAQALCGAALGKTSAATSSLIPVAGVFKNPIGCFRNLDSRPPPRPPLSRECFQPALFRC